MGTIDWIMIAMFGPLLIPMILFLLYMLLSIVLFPYVVFVWSLINFVKGEGFNFADNGMKWFDFAWNWLD